MSEIEDPSQNFMLLLDGVVATGVGPDRAFRRPIPRDVTIQFEDEALTSGTLDIYGSVDGVNWTAIASHAFSAAEITNNGGLFHIINKPVLFIRADLSAYAGTAFTAKAAPIR